MPEKPGKNREQLKEITDRIEAGIRDIFESGDMEKYRNYLRTMSRFHNYSLNNQALIHLQRPDATYVAGYNRWRAKFSRHVLRGEKGITIIAPTPYKKKIEQEKLDPDTKLAHSGCGRQNRHRGKGNRNPHVPPGQGVRLRPDGRKAPAGACCQPRRQPDRQRGKL